MSRTLVRSYRVDGCPSILFLSRKMGTETKIRDAGLTHRGGVDIVGSDSVPCVPPRNRRTQPLSKIPAEPHPDRWRKDIEMQNADENPDGNAIPSPKILSAEALAAIRQRYRAEGKRVVWTNGCFDLVHAGHVLSLESAAALGDILVVGLNSDASVRRLKGPERPYIPQQERAAMLGALACVDHVVIFDGERCTPELDLVQPEVYAQGEDYTLDTIDPGERAAVERGGGTFAFLPFRQGLSTTNLMKRIRRSDPEKIISGAFALIRDEEGRLLMVANRYGEGVKWGLPGGGHHRGETLEETVIREAEEEVGLRIGIRRYLGIIERIDPTLNLHLVAHQFEAEVLGGEVRVDPREEHVIDARWLSAEGLAAHPGLVLGREHLLRYLADPTGYPNYILMREGEE